MTVDMSKAVEGATVHFRCGISANVHGVYHREDCGQTVLTLDGWDSITFDEDGTRFTCSANYPLTIIRIEPPVFDWSSVKNGQAFKCAATGLIRFVGIMPVFGKAVFETSSGITWDCEVKDLKHLTRAPEHDIGVKQ